MAVKRYNGASWVVEAGGVGPNGLIPVKPTSVTVGSGSYTLGTNGKIAFTGASSIEIVNAFSSSYDNYRVVMNFTGTGDSRIDATLVGSATGYYDNYQIIYNNGTTAIRYNSNGTEWDLGLTGSTTRNNCVFDIQSPYLAETTSISGNTWIGRATAGSASFSGTHNVTTSYTNLKFNSVTGTWTGTIRIYGYNNNT